MLYKSEKNEIENLKNLLKEKVDHEVKLLLHVEIRDEELGNMNPHITAPRVLDEEYQINFLGVYGINEKPIYIYGRHESEDKLYRNSSNIWVGETGNPNHEDSATLIKLDNINVKKWFSDGNLLDYSELQKKIKAEEPNEEYLAKEILEGILHYQPGIYNVSFSILTNPKFIDNVLKYLERIV